jgi:hypothetical protein
VRGAVGAWMADGVLAASQVISVAPVVIGREPLDTFLERVTAFHADIRWMTSALPRPPWPLPSTPVSAVCSGGRSGSPPGFKGSSIVRL